MLMIGRLEVPRLGCQRFERTHIWRLPSACVNAESPNLDREAYLAHVTPTPSDSPRPWAAAS